MGHQRQQPSPTALKTPNSDRRPRPLPESTRGRSLGLGSGVFLWISAGFGQRNGSSAGTAGVIGPTLLKDLRANTGHRLAAVVAAACIITSSCRWFGSK